MFYLNVSMCATCVPGVQGGKKRRLDPTELDLGMVVSHHMGVENRTRVLCKSNKCYKLLSHLSSSGSRILSYS